MLIFSMSREELGNKGSECVGLAETCGGYISKQIEDLSIFDLHTDAQYMNY